MTRVWERPARACWGRPPTPARRWVEAGLEERQGAPGGLAPGQVRVGTQQRSRVPGEGAGWCPQGSSGAHTQPALCPFLLFCPPGARAARG